MLRADRQLASSAVSEYGKRYAGGSAVIEELVHRGADGATGVEHVVHQQELAPADVEGNPGALRIVVEPLRMVIIAVEHTVHSAERQGETQPLVQPLRKPHAPGVNADH